MKKVELTPEEQAVTLVAGGREYLVQIEGGRLHVSVMDNDHIMLVHPSSSNKVVVQSVAQSRFEEMERQTRTPVVRPEGGAGSAHQKHRSDGI